jgi:hypothetical protein
MHSLLAQDLLNFDVVLEQALEYTKTYLHELDTRPVAAVQPVAYPGAALPDRGVGAKKALNKFVEHYGALLSASPGPRYFGFVTGGGTPAAVAADWLVSVYDQNTQLNGDTCAPYIEREAIEFLIERCINRIILL